MRQKTVKPGLILSFVFYWVSLNVLLYIFSRTSLNVLRIFVFFLHVSLGCSVFVIRWKDSSPKTGLSKWVLKPNFF